MPGIFLIEGGDLRIPAGSIQIPLDGSDPPPITPHLRTDMWPTWLADMTDAAADARTHNAELAEAIASEDEQRKAKQLRLELRASMRAITGAAFAVDAFYASVRARGGPHPDEPTWRANRTSRVSQIHETLRFHLKPRGNAASQDLRKFIATLFRHRGAAVHPGSKFREPIFRADMDAGVDWHFAVFSRDHALAAAKATTEVLDACASWLDRGHPDLKSWQAAAQSEMTKAVAHYRSLDLLPLTLRSEAVRDEGTGTE